MSGKSKAAVIAFAYVIYEKDKVREIVPVSNIRDFAPKNKEDFDKNSNNYLVKWRKPDEKYEEGDSRSETDEEDFYKAQVLILGCTEKEISDVLQSWESKGKRFCIPKARTEEIKTTKTASKSSGSKKSSSVQQTFHDTKQKNREKEKSQKTSFESILTEKIEMQKKNNTKNNFERSSMPTKRSIHHKSDTEGSFEDSDDSMVQDMKKSRDDEEITLLKFKIVQLSRELKKTKTEKEEEIVELRRQHSVTSELNIRLQSQLLLKLETETEEIVVNSNSLKTAKKKLDFFPIAGSSCASSSTNLEPCDVIPQGGIKTASSNHPNKVMPISSTEKKIQCEGTSRNQGLILKKEEPSKSPEQLPPPSPCIEKVQLSSDDGDADKSDNIEEHNDSVTIVPKLFFIVGEKIHLGNDVWVKIAAWNTLERTASDSKYVRQLAYAIYGEELANISTQGKKSPRTPDAPAKRQMSPRKLAVIKNMFTRKLTKEEYPSSKVKQIVESMTVKYINSKSCDMNSNAAAKKIRKKVPKGTANGEVKASGSGEEKTQAQGHSGKDGAEGGHNE